MSFVKDLKEIEKKMLQAINSVTNKNNLDDLAQASADDIKRRTRLGLGVEKNGEQAKKLKPLKSTTVERRKKLREEGKMSSHTNPSKSNLTATGDMIADVKPDSEPGRNRAIIEATTKESRRKIRKNIDNGRSFLNMSALEIQRACKFVDKRLAELLNILGL